MARVYYRLRAPWLLDPEGSASVSVRVGGQWDPLLVRVGTGRWGGSLPVDAGWALWRCLGEALRSTGDPPAWLSRDVEVAVPSARWRWPSRRGRDG